MQVQILPYPPVSVGETDPRFRPKEFLCRFESCQTCQSCWNSSEVERLPEEQSVGGAIPSSSTKHSWRNSGRGGLQNRYTWGRHPPNAPFICPIGLTNRAQVYGTCEVGLTPAWDATQKDPIALGICERCKSIGATVRLRVL